MNKEGLTNLSISDIGDSMISLRNVSSLIVRIFSVLTTRPQVFRQRLQREGILSLMVVLLLFAGYEAWRYTSTRREVTKAQVHQALNQAERTFDVFTKQLITVPLEHIKDWGEQTQISVTDPKSLNSQLMPFLGRIPSQVLLYLANSDGEEYFLMKEQLFWQTRVIMPDADAEWTQWESPATIRTTWQESASYDPRQQIWYQKTVESEDEITWILPALDSLSDMQSLAGAIGWTDDERTWVASVHIHFSDLLRLLAILSVPEQGFLAVMTDGNVSSIFSGSTFEDAPLSNRQDEAYQQAQIALKELADVWPSEDSDPLDMPSFTMQDTVWWAGVRGIPLQQQSAWLVMAMPEVESLHEIRQRRQSILTTVLGVLLGLVILLALQIRFVRNMVHELDAQQRQLTEDESCALTAMIRQGESLTQEFKSTVRWSLKTGKPDKGLELAWLKTVAAYLNTKGGRIFLGVKDDGEILGLESDQFKNTDKLLLHVNNLLKQHIGLEFSHYITVELHMLEEHEILLITCLPSKEPVFLRHNQQEHFYIRTGPSSVKLSGSEMLKYLATRAE
jgi:hypothetical protein